MSLHSTCDFYNIKTFVQTLSLAFSLVTTNKPTPDRVVVAKHSTVEQRNK